MFGWSGNQLAARVDLIGVENETEAVCRTVREVLSASWDDETDAPRWADEHLAGCAACARWMSAVARVDRMLRVGPVVEQGPDLADTLLPVIALPRRSRWRDPVRVVLALVALVQLLVGLTTLLAPAGVGLAMAAGAHMDHEEAAFNVAFGIALVTVAWNSRRAAGQVPVLGTFLIVLAVSSVFDLADGAVTWSRLATHLPVVVGLLLSVALGRGPHAEPGPTGRGLRPAPSGRPVQPLTWDESVEPVKTIDQRMPPPAARRDVA